jgi:ribonuclease HI
MAGYIDTPIQVYTDESKQEQGFGSGAVIFKESEMIAKIQFKLDSKCSNNQAEQLAILKTLKKLEVLNKQNINTLATTIFTDSRITLDLLQNYNNHGFLVKKIRKKVATLESSEWQIRFSWVKSHIGVHGNQLADKVAKEAAQSIDTRYEYTRIPCSSRRGQTKIASRMDNKQQGGCKKTALSIRAGQTKDKTNTNHETSSRADRTRDNKGIPLPVQSKGRRKMHMRPRRSYHGPSIIPLRKDQQTTRGSKTTNK